MVSCPRCSGLFPISQGDASLIDGGKPVAYHGCKTACGATLIAGSQIVTTTDPSAGTGGVGAAASDNTGGGALAAAAAAALTQGFGHVGASLLAGYEEEPLEDDEERFRGRFRLLDLETGEPISGEAVRVRSTGGQSLTGATDADGYTQWAERDATEALAFDLIEQGRP